MLCVYFLYEFYYTGSISKQQGYKWIGSQKDCWLLKKKKSTITWDFYTPPIDIHCNHQRRLNHKIQGNGGVGNERF